MTLVASVNDRPVHADDRQRLADDDMLAVGLTPIDFNDIMGRSLPHSLVDGRERMSLPHLKHTA